MVAAIQAPLRGAVEAVANRSSFDVLAFRLSATDAASGLPTRTLTAAHRERL